MAKENLSQRVLLELLTKEIETLKKASNIVKTSVNETGQYVEQIHGYLERIKGEKIPLDDSQLKQTIKTLNFQRKALIWVFGMGLAMNVGIFGGVKAYLNMKDAQKDAEKWEKTAEYWYDKAVEFGYEPEEE
jgi:hypothetical protein